MSTKHNPAPFGSALMRFGKLTSHPSLDPSGLYSKRPPACDPCLYHPKELHQIFPVSTKRKVTKDPWKCNTELEEWAKNLGYRNQKILRSRKWFGSLLGPAWYHITEYKLEISPCNNLGFGRTSRKKKSRNFVPGPGTYYKETPFKVPYGPHSIRPTFEREEPCRFKDLAPNWSLAANRYRIIDSNSIEQKPKKLVSIRGPYDLFTGKRDMSTIKNHFNGLKCPASTWPLMLKGCMETYKKSHFGVMNKTNRSLPFRGRSALVDISMCVKKPEDPNAASYNIDKPKTFKQFKHGFNSSYDRPPGYQRVIVWPGVGRYGVKGVECGLPGHGHKNVFLSKQQRTIGAIIPEPLNSF